MPKQELYTSWQETKWKLLFLLVDFGDFGMKPNFDEMTRSELKAYVLQHREDMEAIRALFNRPEGKWVTMPPMFTPEGEPIEENIKFCEEALKKRIEQGQQKEVDG
jgi:hypothetical protein